MIMSMDFLQFHFCFSSKTGWERLKAKNINTLFDLVAVFFKLQCNHDDFENWLRDDVGIKDVAGNKFATMAADAFSARCSAR